ncbi:MAG: DUF481 domain-containing protein [Chromatiales bacterium]|jgi:putative salt-induced outer membrane protein|nr:DUF481 domain-containing protein [Chromatiales bacterium]
MKKVIFTVVALAMSGAVFAQAPDEAGKPLSAEVGLGIVKTTGNSDTSSVNASGEVVYQVSQWRHSGRLEGFRASADGQKTAERYLGTGKSDYHLDDRNYLFGLLTYEQDHFSGFDYQTGAVTGYGRDVLRGAALNANIEAGVGVRYFEESDIGKKDSEGTLRFAGALSWNISDTAVFAEELNTTIGETMTVSKSITSLSTQVVGNLAAKTSLQVRHISDVPPDVKKTDTTMTVNLVYKY